MRMRSDWDFACEADPAFDRDALLASAANTLEVDRIDLVDLDQAGALLRHRVAGDGVVVIERAPGAFKCFWLDAVKTWCDLAAGSCSTAARRWRWRAIWRRHRRVASASSAAATRTCRTSAGSRRPERRVLFSINDLDETLPAPTAWDVKGRAASFEVACRDNGLKDYADQNEKDHAALARAIKKGTRTRSQLGKITGS
jgi:hypothetical protein